MSYSSDSPSDPPSPLAERGLGGEVFRDWTVLLIGGASATGKSTLADGLAPRLDARLKARVVDVDLFWMVLQRTVPAETAPDLHFFHSDASWALPVEEMLKRYLRVSAYICKAIEKAVANYLFIQRPAIFEGTWLLPSLAAQSEYAGDLAGGGVRSVFLYEPDPAQHLRELRGRPDGWFLSQPEAYQLAQAALHHASGNEIKAQAEALNLPVLQSRPFDTLLARALEALDLPSSS